MGKQRLNQRLLLIFQCEWKWEEYFCFAFPLHSACAADDGCVMMGWLKLKLRLVCACAAVVVHFRCACNENAGKGPTQPTHTLHYVKKMKKEKAFIQPLPS